MESDEHSIDLISHEDSLALYFIPEMLGPLIADSNFELFDSFLDSLDEPASPFALADFHERILAHFKEVETDEILDLILIMFTGVGGTCERRDHPQS